MGADPHELRFLFGEVEIARFQLNPHDLGFLFGEVEIVGLSVLAALRGQKSNA